MDDNIFYKLAWYTFIWGHWLVFLPMSFVWPLTYIGNSTVIDFYDMANWYFGTLLAVIVYAIVALMWTLAGIFYSTDAYISSQGIWIELLIYTLVEGFSWFVTVNEYHVAHFQYYYAWKRN